MRHAFRIAMAGLFAAAILLGGAAASAQTPVAPAADQWHGLKPGVASYSLRNKSLEEAIAITKRLGMENICLKSMHLPLESTPEQCAAAAKLIKDSGLNLVGCGVITISEPDEAKIRSYFEYAKASGMPLIASMPVPAALPIIEKMVKEYDIKLAIHNHGPDSNPFPSPLQAYEAIASLDKRIGICFDIGHAARNGEDEIAVLKKVGDRVIDFHLKDVTARTKEGKMIGLGKGVIRLKEALAYLMEIKYQGALNLEYEIEPNDPEPGMKDSYAWLKKALDEIALEAKPAVIAQ